MDFDALTATRHEFLAEWEHARLELDEQFANLSDAELEEPGMTGEWSGRMTLIHLARWDEVAAEMITREWFGELEGVNEYDDYETWNHRWAEIDRLIPLDVAMARYATAHEALVRTLVTMPDDAWTASVRGWVRECSINHYRHHGGTTALWRSRH